MKGFFSSVSVYHWQWQNHLQDFMKWISLFARFISIIKESSAEETVEWRVSVACVSHCGGQEVCCTRKCEKLNCEIKEFSLHFQHFRLLAVEVVNPPPGSVPDCVSTSFYKVSWCSTDDVFYKRNILLIHCSCGRPL